MHKERRFTGEQHWVDQRDVNAETYSCGYCSSPTGSGKGYHTADEKAFIRICPYCNAPTFFSVHGIQWPGSKPGLPVSGLEQDVKTIFEEARSSVAANAFTGAVMLCRKILMHVAVEKGADENQSFQNYVNWLIDQRYAPRGAEVWLDYIRNRAHDANHEIMLMGQEDAIGVLRFTEALLRGVYELPSLVPVKQKESDQEAQAEPGVP